MDVREKLVDLKPCPFCGGEYVDGVWQPNKQGLGMGHVFDVLNDLYGDEFIKY